MRSIRIGSGAGFGNDRIKPALDLLEKGELDFLCLECLAERTVAMAQQNRRLDPEKGYNSYLVRRMSAILPLAHQNHVKVITNMGGANVRKAVERTAEIAKEKGLSGLKIVGVQGDDIFDRLDQYQESDLLETKGKLKDLKEPVAANAYIGCAPIVEALQMGADIVITGRCADPALFLAPLVYSFHWNMDDYDKIGKGTCLGHLLECSVQVSGGNFCIPGWKDVERLEEIGYPFADVAEDGTFTISKVEGTGGRIDRHTCAEQLIYEIHDPTRYLTPDCIADFSNVQFEEIGKDRVRVTGATGTARPETLKVSVGYRDGYTGSAGLSFGGPKCFERTVLAARTLEQIISRDYETEELKVDIIGYNSLFPRDYELGFPGGAEPLELRLRVAARAKDRETLELIANEVDTLTIGGPANCGGLSRSIKELVAVLSILIPRTDIHVLYVVEEV